MTQTTLRLAHSVCIRVAEEGRAALYRFQDESNGRAAFLSGAKLCDRYPLVVATKYNVPMILDAPGTGKVRHVIPFFCGNLVSKHLHSSVASRTLYQQNSSGKGFIYDFVKTLAILTETGSQPPVSGA